MCLVSSKCSLSNKPNTELSAFLLIHGEAGHVLHGCCVTGISVFIYAGKRIDFAKMSHQDFLKIKCKLLYPFPISSISSIHYWPDA